MPRLFYLQSARADFNHITIYIWRQSGSRTTARKFVRSLQMKCERLASLPGTMGRQRHELGPDIRSSAHRGYIIYFRYIDDVLEVINILEGHLDADKHFGVGIDPDDDEA